MFPATTIFEKRFARFLQDANDVAAFAKLPDRFGFAIEYTDSVSNLRYYHADFVAVLNEGTHYLIETKGREDPDVSHKDHAAQMWCENASMLTGTRWDYVKVPQKDFEKLEATDFSDLTVFAVPALGLAGSLAASNKWPSLSPDGVGSSRGNLRRRDQAGR